ncbi:DUF4214 domain-containing protein [Methylobacterium sp. WL12]|uniref:DUF4214 domain-containing protein n=1 Tax=Methylobacterium sp. WL12 TaxID=2603890 RepID=UPI0011CB2AE9|nr:DUF4214 domain-containing protein [Methylobacterium sp. WL12]TXM67546.1 DUF4214 domain-containing protein [Methylobacterium sp. WL12]
MALSAAQITLAYQNALQRTPSASEVNSYVAVSNSGALSDAQIFSSISNSQEANTYVDPVVRFYQAAFGRVPDQAGLAQQVKTLEVPGQSLQTIASGFTQSQEFVNKYGTTGAVTEAYVQALYVNVLGRTGTGAEVAAWINTVADPASGYKTAADVLFGFAQSPEFVQRAEGPINTFLSNAAQGTATYTGSLSLPSAVDNSGSNVTLTVNNETLTASTFNAPLKISEVTGQQVQTLTSGDNLQGSGANSTVNASLFGTEPQGTKATVNGVATLNLTAVAGSTYDASNTKGATSFNSVDSNGTLVVNNIGNLATLSSTNANIDSDLFGQFANSLVSGTADTATINLSGAGRGAAAATGIDISAAGQTAGGFETITLNSTGAASRIDTVSSNSAGSAFLKTLNVTGDANLRVDNALTGVTTIDATNFKGNLRVSVDPNLDVKVTGGTGNDFFNFAGGLTNADTIVGGDGRDTLAVSANTGLGDGNKISGVEILRLDGAFTGTFDQNKVTSVDAVVHNSTAAVIIDNFDQSAAADASKGIGILNIGALTVNVEGSAGLGANSDVLNVTYGSTGPVAGTSALQTTVGVVAGGLTVANVETLNLKVLADDAGQTALGTGAITDAAATNVNITGGATNEAFTVSGGNAFGAAGTLTKIDGSSFLGNLTVSGNAGAQQILGGLGDDTLSTGGRGDATTQGDILTGNAGNDVFKFVAADITAVAPNAAVAGTFTGTQNALFTSITDLNLGAATAGTNVDRVDLSAAFNATQANLQVVNSGAATALTGASFGEGLNNLINNGVLDTNGASGAAARAGLFTFGGETFLVANEGATANTTFAQAAAAGDAIVIKVTGVTGTLDVSDIILTA